MIRGLLALLFSAASVSRVRAQDADSTPHLCISIQGHTAPIRALAFTPDGSRLCTAGLDKAVRVWRLPPADPALPEPRTKAVLLEELWGNERTLRWEVARGLRGSIYAMACCPVTGRITIGGYGARGYLGDLAWIDPVSGLFQRAQYVHRQSISALSYSASGRWLASMDLTGQVVLWSSDGEKARVVVPSDRDRYGPETARAIRGLLRFRPMVVAGDRSIVVPAYSGPDAGGTATWQLEQYDPESGKPRGFLAALHRRAVLALAASSDGCRLASADQDGQLLLWDLAAERNAVRPLATSQPVISLAFSPDGNTLVAGTARTGQSQGAEVQFWDVPGGRLLRRRAVAEAVYACAVSPDGQRLAYVGGPGHDVYLESLRSPQEPMRFEGGRQVAQVALVQRERDYHLVFQDHSGDSAPAHAFDFGRLQVTPGEPVAKPSQFCGQWSFLVTPAENSIWLYRERQPQAVVRLDSGRQGIVRSCSWVPGAAGQPAALAVGTTDQCGVYVYQLPRGGECALARYFRGHYDEVSSVSASSDGRYLASGSRDGTIRCWSLAGLTRPLLFQRWGAEFAVRDNTVVVDSLDDLGPLYHKGIRPGDLLVEMLWTDGEATRSEAAAQTILSRLESLPADAQVAFRFRRGDDARPPFNLVGAWHPLLTFYHTDRDWIAWTTSGYYACSAGGERLIGWQVNNALGEPPSFFPAEHYSKTFYRPDVIRSLLPEGSLRRALGGENRRPADVAEIRPPRVEIVVPQSGRVEQQNAHFEITAAAEAVGGQTLTSMQILLDGRPFQRRSFDDRPRRRTETWRLELPAGEHQIRVQADTGLSHNASREIRLAYVAPQQKKPVLYVLAVGISRYRTVKPLEFGHSDAEALVAVLRRNGSGLFDRVEARTLRNEQATRQAIETGLDWLTRSADWPDVALVTFSGHGLNDSQGRFYLVPVDGDPAEPGRRAIADSRIRATCVSDAKIKEFCRQTRGKLMILIDACHAGAIRIDVSDLARDLGRNDYGVIVMSSSRGNETSLEDRRWGGGAFTKALVDGLEGRADSRQKGFVLSPIDIDPYVYYTVLELTNNRQTPISNRSAVAPFPITRSTVH